MTTRENKLGNRLRKSKIQQKLSLTEFRQLINQGLIPLNNDLYALNCVYEFHLDTTLNFIAHHKATTTDWQTGLLIVNTWLHEKSLSLATQLAELSQWAEEAEVSLDD